MLASYSINNQAVEICERFFEEHISLTFTTGANDQNIHAELTIYNNLPPLTAGIQRSFVDNVVLEAAVSTKVAFQYNDRGQRVKKESYNNQTTYSTYYVRDAAGSVLAVYTKTAGPFTYQPLQVKEHSIYGSGRIGVFKRENTLPGGYALYELTDHLGNVRAVIMKSGGNVLSLTAKTDYYPFGMPMPNRHTTDNNYRYAFQGQEKDSETGMEAFELRLWDGRIGRWLTTDPKHDGFSPYWGMNNNPIGMIDPDGGSADWHKDKNGNLVADPGDNAYTLAKYLNTSPEIAIKLLTDQGYKVNKNGVLNLKVNDVLKVEHHSTMIDDARPYIESPLGHNAREFAGSAFSKDLFERYWFGDGDLELSNERFTGILLFLKDLKPKITSVTKINARVTAKVTSFYSSKEYDKAFGSATVYYNKNNEVIGFHDTYDFNPIDFSKTHRSLKNEIITRMVNYSSTTKSKAYEINYGYHK